jgi:hypothetical protein
VKSWTPDPWLQSKVGSTFGSISSGPVNLPRYDNLASEVRKILRGYRREKKVRFLAFRAARKAVRRRILQPRREGHEKGGIEGKVVISGVTIWSGAGDRPHLSAHRINPIHRAWIILSGECIRVPDQSRTSGPTEEIKNFDEILDPRSIYRPEPGNHHAGGERRPLMPLPLSSKIGRTAERRTGAPDSIDAPVRPVVMPAREAAAGGGIESPVRVVFSHPGDDLLAQIRPVSGAAPST